MSKIEELKLSIEGMHCASCVANIEKNITALDGIKSCSVNLALSSAAVKYDTILQSPDQIFDEIKELGFKPSEPKEDILDINTRATSLALDRFGLAALLTLPLMLVAMWPMITDDWLVSATIDGSLQTLISALILILPGREILVDAFRQTTHLRANMNSLVAMGTLTAFGWSLFALPATLHSHALYFDSVGMIISLILLGRLLEARTRGRAGQAIKALLKLRPSKAMASINGVEIEIDTAAINEGMTLLIRPGERIPADGDILTGQPNIDESMLTGESMPVEKNEGDDVIGGGLNGNIPFTMKVTASGEKSFLASIVRIVSDAQARKAPVQALADRVAAVFVPIVLLMALVTLAAWYFFAPDSPLMIKSVVSVLIIACPCALGLATPTAVLAGTGRAARAGIIIRGGDILERLNAIDTIVFDKTGTLTHGHLQVMEVAAFDKMSENHLLQLVGSVELQSEHPVAQAIVRYMKHQAIQPVSVRNVVAHPGFGLTAEFDGERILVGSRILMKQEKINLGEAEQVGKDQMCQGRTVVFIALDGRVIGLIALSDRLRGEARELIADLKTWAPRVMMLTGDNRQTAAGIAKALDLDSYEAEVRPEQKKHLIQSLRKAGFSVAMIGDGINDAPALAVADIGIAIGTGTDVAIETADVILVKPDLTNISRLFIIGRHSLRTIKANLFWALFYNVLAIPVAAGILYPVMGLTLSPIIAAAAMSFSSVFVVTNSLRLSQLDLR